MCSLIVKLCGAHPSPEKHDGQRQERWTLVSRAYRKIRQLVLDSPVVMTQTALQLFNINNATLNKWYNDRMKVTIGFVFVFILMSLTVIYLYVQVTRKAYMIVCVSIFRVTRSSSCCRGSLCQSPPWLQRNHCHHQYTGCRSRSYHPYHHTMPTSSQVPLALLVVHRSSGASYCLRWRTCSRPSP